MSYTQNLTSFINSLPLSSIRFLYFKKDETDDWKPILSKMAKKWENSPYYTDPIYIINGVKKDGFCYLYKEGSIKYNVQLDEMNRVKAFEPDNFYVSVGGTPNAKIQAQWGDHITVGIEKEEDYWLLMSHTTKYYQIKNENRYKCRRFYCNVILSKQLNIETPCVYNGISTGQTLDIYEKVCKDKEAFPMLQSIHTKIMKRMKRMKRMNEGGLYTLYNGQKYKIHYGIKGGKYIIRNNKKIYIPKNKLKGGANIYNGESFTDSFIEFLREFYIIPVAEKNKLLWEVSFVDDEESDYLLIVFHENDADDWDEERITAIFFAINKETLYNVYTISQIPIQNRTSVQMEMLLTFTERFIPIRMTAVSA